MNGRKDIAFCVREFERNLNCFHDFCMRNCFSNIIFKKPLKLKITGHGR